MGSEIRIKGFSRSVSSARRERVYVIKELGLLVLTVGLVFCGVAVGQTDPHACTVGLYDCAISFVEQHNFSSAIQILHHLIEEDPHNLKAINLLGIALTEIGQKNQANIEFQMALRISPDFYPAMKNLAVNELAANDVSAAKKHFEEYLKFRPEDGIANLALAEIAFRTNHCEKALPYYEMSWREVIADPRLVLHNVQCAVATGQRRQALEMVDFLPAKDPQDHFRAGVLLGRTEAYPEAAQQFQMARQGYPDPYRAGYNQTLMEFKAGELGKAIRTANALFAQGYQRSELYNLVSEAYLKDGQLEQAYNALRTASKIAPNDVNNYIDLVSICLDYGNYDLGMQVANIGLHYIPNSARLYLERGVVHAMKGQTKEADDDFSSAANLGPQDPLPYVGMGIALMQMGHMKEATEILGKKIKSYPNDFMIPYLYGEALVRSGVATPGTGGEHEAIEAFEASVRLNPNFVHSHEQLGKMLLQTGKTDAAIVELEKAVALDPKDAASAYQLSLAYRRSGRVNRADEMMARVGQIDARDQDRSGFTNNDLKHIVEDGTAAFGQNRSDP